MNSIEIKGVHSEDSSSTSHVELVAAPAQLGITETPPPEAPPPEAPLPGEPPFRIVENVTMSSSNSTPVQGGEGGTFFQREWQTIVRIGIVLLSVISGCLGGFLRHDANLGLEIGANVLAGLLVLFEVLKHKLRFTQQRLVNQAWWPTSMC
ncbi:hypothetical protein GGI35DRAFT_255377 [Trichoderma velutinum]